jgi:hypothetical protein
VPENELRIAELRIAFFAESYAELYADWHADWYADYRISV